MSLKRIVTASVLLSLLIGGAVFAASNRVAVFVDGQPLHAHAIIHEGTTYLPVRAVSEALGMTVDWDAKTKRVYIDSQAVYRPKATLIPAAPDEYKPLINPYQPVYRQPQPAYQEPPPATQDIGPTVHITKSGRKYHRAGCRSLARSDIPISLQDAQADGYTPCKICNP